jgi:hypothetical protein
MTVEQIAHAFHAGHLTARTPLWPPGTSGWQALGNFEQFQMVAQHGGAYDDNQDGLAQFEEADDDPTRMWTGSSDLEMGGGNMNAMPGMQAQPLSPPPPAMRPSSRTGPRQVSQRPPAPPTSPSMRSQPVMSQPVMSQPPMRMTSAASSASPSAPPQFRPRRSSGWLLVAGLVGLVGLGSAVLAARGSWSAAAPSTRTPAAEPPSTDTRPSAAAPEQEVAAVPAAAPEAEPAKTEAAEAAQPEAAQLAKYDDSQPSAFVAGVEHSKVDDTGNAAPVAKAERAAAVAEKPEVSSASQRRLDAAHKSERAEKAEKARTEKAEKAEKARAEKAEKAEKLANEREKTVAVSKRAVAAAAAPAAPKQPKAEAPASAAEPANASVNEAAAAALATSANLASSCRPRGGPAGAGKARVIYSQDGEVQSVEILTAKFRDTLTGSCVRMVFRRAKIPAFKGEPPTFIKSFTIPEE